MTTNNFVEVKLFEPPPVLVLPKPYYGQTDLSSILTNEEDDEKYFADLDIRKNMVLDFLQKNNKKEVNEEDAENVIKIVNEQEQTIESTEVLEQDFDYNKGCCYKFKKYIKILVESEDLDW